MLLSFIEKKKSGGRGEGVWGLGWVVAYYTELHLYVCNWNPSPLFFKKKINK